MENQFKWIESSVGHPLDEPNQWRVSQLTVRGHSLTVHQPKDPDGLLNDPAVMEASEQSGYAPYWAYLWPGALLLADALCDREWLPGTRTLELGCGLGLAGLVALSLGVNVVFSDHSPAALELARFNATANGFSTFDVESIEWSDPPVRSYPLILGADVLYERRCLDEMINVLTVMLEPAGLAMFGDPNRSVSDPFEMMATAAGLNVETQPRAIVQPDGSLRNGRVFYVRKPCSEVDD